MKFTKLLKSLSKRISSATPKSKKNDTLHVSNTVKDFSQIDHITNNHIDVNPKKSFLKNSTIIFSGNNNIIIIEDGVIIENSVIKFNGSNSIIYLSKSHHPYHITTTINNNSKLYIGKNNYFNGNITLIISEEKNIIIGNNCLFSFGIFIRTADPHLIYDIQSEKRINPSKSVLIGDHVWIGQDCLILKNTFIGSGSIIGGNSVVSGKKIPSNQVWAGNPIRKIRDGIFWTEECVHSWTKEKTEQKEYKNAQHIYSDNAPKQTFSPEHFDIFELASNLDSHRFSYTE